MRAGLWPTAALLVGLVACTAPGGSGPPGGTKSAEVLDRVDPAEAAEAVRKCLAAGCDPTPGAPTTSEGTELASLYGPAHEPLWTDATGRLRPAARQALALLSDARSEGLDLADYRIEALSAASSALDGAAVGAASRALAGFDVALSRAVLRYFRHVHLGRVDAGAVGFRLDAQAEAHDFGALLRSALGADRIDDALSDLRPAIPQYDALRAALPKYRSVADHTDEEIPPAPGPVRVGDSYVGIAALHRRLVALGDLPADAPPPAADAYGGALVEGVKRFQVRHGLAPDGVLGAATLAALRVPLAWRVRQIELALERLRWLPDFGEGRLVAINIPMFRLFAWDAMPPGGPPAIAMDVIVGRALRTETPVFAEPMREVIFQPYWNVPRSILLDEILPALDKDSGYLRARNMEIVREQGDSAEPVADTPANVALLRQGGLRLRQRPGPENALGLVKFVFPNEEDVYLHATPAPELFSRSRRDFSHGCVRVEEPVTLAEWVLKDQPGWTRQEVLAAMAGPPSRRVALAAPIQVVLFYTTAAVMPDDGSLHFAQDIYGNDARLDGALAARVPGSP
jgi:murein L,D-transpeptidase YcbB/YkuD